MTGWLHSVDPTADEVSAGRPGDELLPVADVVMDRAFTVEATPEVVWPWLVQLGKQRAGWYFPRSVERVIPQRRRALRDIEPRWHQLAVGDVIPDYGGRNETFQAAAVNPPTSLLYTSQRGRTSVTWSIQVTPTGGTASRVHLRLRMHPIKHRWLAEKVGGLFDLLTIAGMASGLRERLRASENGKASGRTGR